MKITTNCDHKHRKKKKRNLNSTVSKSSKIFRIKVLEFVRAKQIVQNLAAIEHFLTNYISCLLA